MTEIERLAQAAINNHYALYGPNSALPIDERTAPDFVRAILTALREPSEVMLHAAFVEMNATPSGTWEALKAANVSPERLFVAKMRPRWQAAIDAVLADPDDTDARAGSLGQTGFA